MLNRIGLCSTRAFVKASSPHGYQSTGLCACCKRYGLVSCCSRLVCLCSLTLACPFSSPAPILTRAVEDRARRGRENIFLRLATQTCSVILASLNGDSFFILESKWNERV